MLVKYKIQQIISEMLRIIDQTAHRHVYLTLLYELQNLSSKLGMELRLCSSSVAVLE